MHETIEREWTGGLAAAEVEGMTRSTPGLKVAAFAEAASID